MFFSLQELNDGNPHVGLKMSTGSHLSANVSWCTYTDSNTSSGTLEID